MRPIGPRRVPNCDMSLFTDFRLAYVTPGVVAWPGFETKRFDQPIAILEKKRFRRPRDYDYQTVPVVPGERRKKS